MKRSSDTPKGVIHVQHNTGDYGVTVTASIPGYAGHVITRSTLAEALRVLADAIAQADARHPRAVGVA
jgi:hypothetical protein